MSNPVSEINDEPENEDSAYENRSFIQHRIFLNSIDNFNCLYIAAYVTDQIYGASKIAFGEEALGEEPPVAIDTPRTDTEEKKVQYEAIGRLQYDHHKPSEDFLYSISDYEPENYQKEILQCGFVIFDITQNPEEIKKALEVLAMMEAEVERIKEIGPKTFARYPYQRTFILISTIMTWGKTKPPRNPNMAFTEAQYKIRKAHPNYEEHIACEREVVLVGRKYPNHLKTYVVCSGIIYGEEESDFAGLFKLAWMNEQYLPVFSPGSNFVPVIHIGNLSRILVKLMDFNPGNPQFILAVEPNPVTLKKIVTALANSLGNGKTKMVTEAEAFLYDEFPQEVYEKLTVDLKMEPEYVQDALQVEWLSDFNLVQNMKKMVGEYVEKNNVKANKIIIHGPPAVGKTKLAKALEEKYGLHYISVKSLIEESLAQLRMQIEDEKARVKELEEKLQDKQVAEVLEDEEVDEEELGEEEEQGGNIEDWEEEIREITAAMEGSPNGKLPDDMVNRLLRRVLTKNVCQYKGYVLDGYPKTYQQAKEIFGQSGEAAGGEEGEAEEEFAGMIGNASKKLLPDFVISLQASDDFLCERVMDLPESEVQDTHYNEEGMIRRLAEFRANNIEENTVLNFYDEIEIHPIVINIENEETGKFECILEHISNIVGPAATFKLTFQEVLELEKILVEKRKLGVEEAILKKRKEDEECQKQFQNKMEEWNELMVRYQEEEEKVLAARAEPLRFYLMKYVFPVLIKALIETAKCKPEDPVDFLAEYLFRENPEGKMFDPAYTTTGEQIISKFEQLSPLLEPSEK